MARISIPASRARRNGMKPAGDQSLSMIAYLFSGAFLRVWKGEAEIEPARHKTNIIDLKSCIVTGIKRTRVITLKNPYR